MAIDATKVLVGAPDQAVTGAVLSGPLDATAPTSAVDTLDVDFTDSGFVSDQGVELAPSISTTSIKDWSGSVVRKLIEEFDGTIKWAHLETNEASMKNYLGEANVTVTAASATHGKQIKGAMGAYDLPRKSWIFKVKDGANRILIYVPIGQVTERESIKFQKSAAVGWGVTLSTYPDALGNSIYIFTDDGVTTA